MVAVVGFNLDLGKLKEQLSFGGVVVVCELAWWMFVSQLLGQQYVKVLVGPKLFTRACGQWR